jgi:hypothetical protein
MDHRWHSEGGNGVWSRWPVACFGGVHPQLWAKRFDVERGKERERGRFGDLLEMASVRPIDKLLIRHFSIWLSCALLSSLGEGAESDE